MGGVCLVVPCYNEARRLDRGAFEQYLDSDGAERLWFVDDGSTDDTRALLEALVAAHPDRARLETVPRNVGKAEAVRRGMRGALEDGAGYVGYWDADLATPLAQIAEFMALFAERPAAEVVIGSRVRMLGRSIDRSGHRHLIGRFYATLASLTLGLPIYDTQCGAKIFRASATLDRALSAAFRSRWSFDVELLQRLQHGWGDRGLERIVEIPLPAWRDVGSSKVSPAQGAAAFAALLRLNLGGSRSLPMRSAPQAKIAEGTEVRG